MDKNKRTNAYYSKVGALVVALLVLLIAFIFYLSSNISLEQYTTYVIYEQESVSGLDVDSQVEFNGVLVGGVKSITLDPKNPRLVIVLINVKSDTPITRGTRATLTTRGVTGIVNLALKDNSMDLRPLIIQPGQLYLSIPTAPSIFLRLDTAITTFDKAFKKIGQAVQSVMNTDDVVAMKSIGVSVKELRALWNDNRDNMRMMSGNFGSVGREMNPLIQTVKKLMASVGDIAPKSKDLLLNIEEIISTLRDIASTLKSKPETKPTSTFAAKIKAIVKQVDGPCEEIKKKK